MNGCEKQKWRFLRDPTFKVIHPLNEEDFKSHIILCRLNLPA